MKNVASALGKEWSRGSASLGLAIALSFGGGWLRADQVEMQNGDRYVGNVLSLTTNKLVIQSDVLGKVTLPREKVAAISFGAATKTSTPRVVPQISPPVSPPQAALSSTGPDLSASFRSLGANTNISEQVRGQFLAGAGPDANKKFDELLSGLATGKLNLDSIRSEAKSAASQLRALKKDLGPDASEPLDAYLEILDNFLKEAAPPASSAGVAQPVPKP